MERRNLISLSVWLCGLLSLSGLCWSQTTEALQRLQDRLTRNHPTYVVILYGIRVTTNVIGRPAEMRVKDGVVARGAARWVHGDRDVSIPVGQTVEFQRVEAVEDAKNDLLRVSILALGSVVPVSFAVPKGSLSTMTEQQMEALVETAFRPQGQQLTGGASPAMTQAGSELRAGQRKPSSPANEPPLRTPLPSENVLELEGLLKGHNGDAIVKAEGIRAAMQSPDYTRDNVIVDGVFQPRQTGGVYRGMRDVVLWPNSHATFVQLAAFTDDGHDILYLVVRGSLGEFAPISFLLPKGELTAMSKRDIMHTMQPFVVFAAADENTFRNEPGADSGRDSKHQMRPTTAAKTDGITAGNALRATRPPHEGCMWVPYLSKAWSLELLRELCDHRDSRINDVSGGIGMRIGGPAETADIRILSKPAALPIETAIQQQIVAKLKDPAARANCRAVRLPQEEQPGWHEYEVRPFGAYAQSKLPPGQNAEKGDGERCDGLYGGDVSNVFVYNPAVSKTHFFALYGLTESLNGQPFDLFSLRFLNRDALRRGTTDN